MSKIILGFREMISRVKAVVIEYPLFFILFFAFLVRVIYLFLNYPLWWDSHVYIGMGKYIFSGGQLGIWEVFRPILYPLLLGLFWKFGFNPIIFGKIMDLLLSLICIYLVYKIAKEVFNEKVAL